MFNKRGHGQPNRARFAAPLTRSMPIDPAPILAHLQGEPLCICLLILFLLDFPSCMSGATEARLRTAGSAHSLQCESTELQSWTVSLGSEVSSDNFTSPDKSLDLFHRKDYIGFLFNMGLVSGGFSSTGFWLGLSLLLLGSPCR